MEHEETSQNDIPVKFSWKFKYTWVLLLNAAYIILFYLLMKSYS